MKFMHERKGFQTEASRATRSNGEPWPACSPGTATERDAFEHAVDRMGLERNVKTSSSKVGSPPGSVGVSACRGGS